MNSSADLERRQALIDGLLKLLTFLEEHPGVPINGWAEISFCVQAEGDDAGIATTVEVAQALGVEMTDSHGKAITDETTHFSAIRRFGPAVSYRATYIRRDEMDDWLALTSYSGAVKANENR